MIRHFPAPKGHHAIAQGNALGMVPKKPSLALKGRNLAANAGAVNSTPPGSAPSGREVISDIQPRALPWAIASSPVGAWPWIQTGGCPMNRYFSAPKGHHVKAQGNALGMAPQTIPSPERA